MFGDIFGAQAAARAGRRGGSPRGYDLETEVEIDLADVLSGYEADVEFTRLDVCGGCAGSGAKPGTEPVRCETCGGRGHVVQTGFGGMFRMQTACPRCHGRGSIVVDKCETCRGKGREPKKRSLTVRIPPGIRDGQAVRVGGEGEPPPQEISPAGEGVRGDLHVVVRVREHEVFRREGDHLVLEMPIGYSQAALGAHLEVPTLEEPASIVVPRGTQHGAILRVQGSGLPNLRSGRRGDLVIAIRIEVPRKLNDRQERLLRELAEIEGEQGLLPEKEGFWDKIKDLIGGA